MHMLIKLRTKETRMSNAVTSIQYKEGVLVESLSQNGKMFNKFFIACFQLIAVMMIADPITEKTSYC